MIQQIKGWKDTQRNHCQADSSAGHIMLLLHRQLGVQDVAKAVDAWPVSEAASKDISPHIKSRKEAAPTPLLNTHGRGRP
jgi:hypothetical protein